MPRIYTSSNDPVDFCVKCFPNTCDAAQIIYGDIGDGPDGRGNCFDYNADHPDYDGEDYICCQCKKQLTNKDNYPD